MNLSCVSQAGAAYRRFPIRTLIALFAPIGVRASSNPLDLAEVAACIGARVVSDEVVFQRKALEDDVHPPCLRYR